MRGEPQGGSTSDRRGFLSRLVMFTGLGAVATLAAGIGGRYLYPLRALSRRRTIFLAPIADIPPGKGRPYGLPGGATALVADTGTGIVALSDVCPHLGCKVHFDPAASQFLCPCHGGVFDKEGTAVAGPPADEGKNLRRYVLTRLGDNLFVEIEETIPL